MWSLSLVPDAELLTAGYFLGDRGGAPCSNEATLGALLAASGRGQADKPGSAAWNVQPHLLSSERGERLEMALMVDHAYMTTLLKTPKLRRSKSFWVGEHIRVLEGGTPSVMGTEAPARGNLPASPCDPLRLVAPLCPLS